MKRSGNKPLFILLMALLLTGLVILVANHEQGEVAGLSTGQFGSLVVLLSVGIFIGAGMWHRLRGRISESLVAVAFWLLLAALLAVVYTYKNELQSVGDRVLGQLMPGHVVSRAQGGGEVMEITRSRDGHFSVNAQINGARVSMLVDTGASTVVLTPEAARAAGLPLGQLTYDIPVETANGRVNTAAVTLDRLAVGGIEERRVQALVTPPGALNTSLLGMSFLRRLQGFNVRGDTLVLHGPARP